MDIDNYTRKRLSEDSFQYGNHTVEVTVVLSYGVATEDAGAKVGGHHRYRIARLLYDWSEEYTRWVYVSATQKEGSGRVSHRSSVTLLNKQTGLMKHFPDYQEPSIEDQIEATVRPVLDELDELYRFTTRDVDLDIQLGMERVEHETSWVDVDDEVDRISQNAREEMSKSGQ